MEKLLFVDVRVLDGSGEPAFAGEVLVDRGRIAQVERAPGRIARLGARVVEGRGGTLMPGLIEPHAHLSFTDFAQSMDMGFTPVEEHLLITLRNARTLLEAGFTGCVSAASAKKRLDIVVRNAVERGEFPGPRLLAATPEMTVTGGLGDIRLPHLHRDNYAVILDGADQFQQYARELCREGVDILKINVSGDAGQPAAPAERTVMSEAEVAAVCGVARAFGKRMAAHARSAESVKMCVRHGIELIHHATLVDEEAKDLLEAHKAEVFVCPVLGHLYATCYEAQEWGRTPEAARRIGLEAELEHAIGAMRDLKRRGVRVLPGGDYGFAWNKNGTNARDLEHFVNLLGLTPMEAIVAATRLGGEAMRRADELGQLKPGYLADLLLVDGDPTHDIGVLRQSERLRMVMKGGAIEAGRV